MTTTAKTKPTNTRVDDYFATIENLQQRQDSQTLVTIMQKMTGYQALTIYVMPGFSDFDALLQQLGKYKLGKSCLYVKSLDDVDIDILQKLIKQSVELMKATYGITSA